MRASFFVLVCLFAACGGKVVVDQVGSTESPAGSGGSGASVGSTVDVGAGGTFTDASSGTGVDCAALQSAFEKALQAAQQCFPDDPSFQCSGSSVVLDTCDCAIIVNEQNQGLVASAQSTRDTWVAAGCGPFQCGKDCPPADFGGFCQPMGNGTGICTGAYPD
jgi:hypothetical protein